MRRIRISKAGWLSLAVVVAVTLAGTVTVLAQQPSPAELLDRAKSDFAEKSFRQALEHYERYLATNAAPHRAQAMLDMAVCQQRLQRFDAAIATYEMVAQEFPDLIWGVHAHRQRALLRTIMPNHYYEKDGVKHWGRWVQQAVYHNAAASNLADAKEQILLAETKMHAWAERPARRRTAAEVRDDMTLLAAIKLEVASIRESDDLMHGWGTDTYKIEMPDGTTREESTRVKIWPSRDAIVKAYDEAEKLFRDSAAVGADAETVLHAGLALYRKAMFFVTMAQTTHMRLRPNQPNTAAPEVPESDHPIPVLRQVIEKYPHSRRAPEAWYGIAQFLHMMGRFTEAAAEAKKLREAYPKSKWVSDALGLEQVIRSPRLQMNAPTSIDPRENLSVALESRNVRSIGIAVYAFDLAGLIRDEAFLADGETFIDRFDSIHGRPYYEKFRGQQLIEITHPTNDTGNHEWWAGNVALQRPQTGWPNAFVVEARAGNISVITLHVATAKALLVRPGVHNALLWFVDKTTGEPISNATLHTKEYFYESRRGGGVAYASHQRIAVDDAGVAKRPVSVRPPAIPVEARTRGMIALAMAPDGTFALTNTAQPRAWGTDWSSHFRWLVYTERPVYRPAQTVYFRGFVRNFSTGRFENLPNRELNWQVRDPRGQQVANGRLQTDAYGAFDAEFALPQNATLGAYRMMIGVVGTNQRTTTHFRVEEYKKPEFEVKVDPSSDRVKLGHDGEATVRVNYYSGGAVAGANAKWRVFHSIQYRRFHFSRDWDWFYGDYLSDATRQGGRTVVAQGEAVCDAAGEFVVRFPTQSVAEQWPTHRHLFSVEVEVTDESRRTITGSGQVVVTQQAFDAYIATRRDLYHPGDRVTFEVRTETASGKPVSAPGVLKIGRLDVYWATDKDAEGNSTRIRKRDENMFVELPVQTDADGRAVVEYTMDAPGSFVARFVTQDADGESVESHYDFLVAGTHENLSLSRFSELRLIAEKRVFEVGQTARIALAAAEPGTVVLCAIETGADDAPHEIHVLDGNVKTFEIPITSRLQPNFFLTVYAIRHGAVQEARLEIFVVPVEKLIDVTLEPAKTEFRPGETGTVKLVAKDKDGNPVRVQSSLAVVDESIYYIAADRTPDPRLHFYKRRRGFNTTIYTSLTFRSAAVRLDANRYRVYESHGMPEGWGMPQSWILRDIQARQQSLDSPAPEMGHAPVRKESKSHDEKALTPPEQGTNPDSNGRFTAVRQPVYARSSDELQRGDPAHGFNSAIGLGGNFGGGGVPSQDGDEASGGAAPRSARGGSGVANGAEADGDGGGDVVEHAEARVRSEFADTAFWAAALTTNAAGEATATVAFPDNLTRWRLTAVVVDENDRVGFARLSVRTNQNIKVRLQAPRFFVETDEVVLSAVVQNDLSVAKTVTVSIVVPDHLQLLPGQPATVVREMPATSRTRVDWRVRVVKAGMATVRMSALTDVESDAHEMTFPAYIHGATKHDIKVGVIAPESAEAAIHLDLPAEIDPTRTKLRISVTPTVANVALDAIPYLVEYPYGCIEQTMSRFMPAIAVRKTLADMGVNLDEVASARQRRDLSAWPIAHRQAYQQLPVFDQRRLEAIVEAGLQRIYDLQHQNGGWGWWSGGTADVYMTAYVVHGLIIAAQSGVRIDQARFARGVQFLFGVFDSERNLHRAAFVAYVLAQTASVAQTAADARARINSYATQVYEKREHLSTYTRAMLVLTLHHLDRREERDIVVRNLIGYANHDDSNKTTWFGEPGGRWWLWHNDRLEQNAWVIRALATVAPTHELLPRLVKWLVNNRDGSRWHSTRATAFAILALAEYSRIRGELDANYTLAIHVNGKVVREIAVNRATLFSLDGDVFLDAAVLSSGPQEIRLVRQGQGTAYFTADLEYFATGEGITAAGHEIFVNRRYFVVTPRTETLADGRQVLQWDRREMAEGEVLESGTLIDVEIEVEAKNDYEYLCFEDYKPAGCEPLDQQSGSRWMNGMWTYIEFRDERVCLFVGSMHQGTAKFAYRMRCEIPGRFHALPTQAHAMYSPNLRANSDEHILTIIDK